MNSGIYRIICLKSGDSYIGSTRDLDRRRSQHFSKLRNNKHKNENLQKAFNKYGEKHFEFEVLMTCPPKDLLKTERYCIDRLSPKLNIA